MSWWLRPSEMRTLDDGAWQMLYQEASLTVAFDGDLRPVRVILERNERTTPTELARFPWGRQIDLLRKQERRRRGDEAAQAELWAALQQQRDEHRALRRPGRRGHPVEETAALARRADELRSKNPRGYWKQLQREAAETLYGGHLPMNTLQSRVKRHWREHGHTNQEEMKP